MASLQWRHCMPLLDDQPMTRDPVGEVSVGAVPLSVSVTVRPPMVSLIVRAVACPIDVTWRPGVDDVTLADPADLARYGLTAKATAIIRRALELTTR